MFTNLQNANIKDSSWLLKENKIYIFNKKDNLLMKELHLNTY